ncbi:MAG: 2-hydroxyacyl-CoA dehydratase family protein [Bacillota bacterium]
MITQTALNRLHDETDHLLSYLDLSYDNQKTFIKELLPFSFFCSYWPEEISLAAGAHPFRVFSRGNTYSPSSLPAYCCTVAKGCLELGEKLSAAKGEQGFGLSGFAHSCDTMQCLSQIWLNTINKNTVTFVPPINLAASGAADYTVAELKKVVNKVSELRGKEITEEDLRKAILTSNKVRRLVSRLEKLRPYYPSGFIASLVRVAQLAPRPEYIKTMDKILPRLEDIQNIARENKIRVLISGAVFENEDLHNQLEELGARVVADDSCSGYRYFAELTEEDLNPFEAIANRLIKRPNCPCRHKGVAERANYLSQLVEERKAQGVIIALRKFCEPHAWDSVSLAEKFKEMGLPVLVLEMEGATPGGQERTRLQAFLESIEGRPDNE